MVVEVLNLDKCIKKFNDIKGIDIMPPIRDGARRVQQKARDIVPVDTGTLKGSIFTQIYPATKSAEVYTNTEYAPYVEFGTRGHRIYPKNAKALRWVGKDKKVHFAKHVDIPPMPPRPFLGRALQEERVGIIQNMDRYLSEEIKKRI